MLDVLVGRHDRGEAAADARGAVPADGGQPQRGRAQAGHRAAGADRRAAGCDGAGIEKLEIQVSGDDGKTWHQAGVVPSGHGAYKAIFATPEGAGTISLKSHLVDAGGNVTDLTVIGAYPLR